MRPRIVLPLIALAATSLSWLGFLHYHRSTDSLQISKPRISENAEPLNSDEPKNLAATKPARTADENNLDSTSPEEQQETSVADRIFELEGLGMSDNPDSLAIILSELNNREPRIRQAALEAATQFGSRDAIPALVDAASRTDDPEEKSSLLKASEFLNLPKLAGAGQ